MDDFETVTLTAVEPYGPFDTVLIFTGADADGHEIAIGVDHRPARELLEALAADGDAAVDIEPWQVLRRQS